MQPCKSDVETCRRTLLVAAALIVCAAGCLASPPEGPLVTGPTLTIEIASVSQANVAGNELVAAAPLGDAAQTARADFLAANAATIGPQRLVALRGARVRLRPGTGVDDLGDAFGGLMIFVAPESNPTARVFLANAVAPASAGPVELELIAKRADYEGLQTVLTGPRFVVGVSGPTSLGADRAVEFGLRVELDLAIMELMSRKGGH
jgi:hypothetical protein